MSEDEGPHKLPLNEAYKKYIEPQLRIPSQDDLAPVIPLSGEPLPKSGPSQQDIPTKIDPANQGDIPTKVEMPTREATPQDFPTNED